MEQPVQTPLISDRAIFLANSRRARGPSTIPDYLQRFRVASINWQGPDLAKFSVSGKSVLYKPGAGLIAKVGLLIEPDEMEAQRRMAALGLALPVIDYAFQANVGMRVSRDVCSAHGIRPVTREECTCGVAHSVLLMPEAAPIRGYQRPEIERFIHRVQAVSQRVLQRDWDGREPNVALYQGHLVALDFGTPEGEDAP